MSAQPWEFWSVEANRRKMFDLLLAGVSVAKTAAQLGLTKGAVSGAKRRYDPVTLELITRTGLAPVRGPAERKKARLRVKVTAAVVYTIRTPKTRGLSWGKRPPMPPGHPISWGAIATGPYPFSLALI